MKRQDVWGDFLAHLCLVSQSRVQGTPLVENWKFWGRKCRDNRTRLVHVKTVEHPGDLFARVLSRAKSGNLCNCYKARYFWQLINRNDGHKVVFSSNNRSNVALHFDHRWIYGHLAVINRAGTRLFTRTILMCNDNHFSRVISPTIKSLMWTVH